MTYNLCMTASHVSLDDKILYEKYGFVFELKPDDYWIERNKQYDLISNSITIKIDSIEDLQILIKDVGEVVISEDTIEIYNDYREE